MAEAVKVLPQEVQDAIEVRIWNVKALDGIIRKGELGSKCIPSIAINNNMVFESGIPLQEDLITAIRNHL